MLLKIRADRAPLHRQIYEALKSGIRDGKYRPGSRLPSTRALCADLGVSRNTVLAAYEQLLAEGYAISRERATTLVAEVVPPRPAERTAQDRAAGATAHLGLCTAPDPRRSDAACGLVCRAAGLAP